MLLMMLAGWLNRHHQDVIEYLKEENKILREQIGKKKAEDRVNNWKLKLANRVIAVANKLMGERYRPFGGFEGFEGIEGLTNSDVVMMLAQYIKCMDHKRADNVYVNLGRWYWRVDGERSNLLTSEPRKLKK